MRDPKRIKRFCDNLAEIWESQCPDWRFSQLVVNACRANDISDPFYVEDEDMLDCIAGIFGLPPVDI